jgi:hypothetical protein
VTVYLVTSGEYSDYHIDAVFSTRELAETYIEASKGMPYADYPQIEEWAVNAEAGKVAREAWTANILLDTGEIRGEAREKLLARPRARKVEGRLYPWNPGISPTSYTALSLVSAAHARKLAVEFRQAWLRKQAEVPE